jgi:TIR domain
MPTDQPKVFISFSHKDNQWRDDLETHLKPYLRVGSLTSWSDKEIKAGSQWLAEIKTALASCAGLCASQRMRRWRRLAKTIGRRPKRSPRNSMVSLWHLDQAAAYIEETACGLSGYLSFCRAQVPELLRLRGSLTSDHPDRPCEGNSS